MGNFRSKTIDKSFVASFPKFSLSKSSKKNYENHYNLNTKSWMKFADLKSTLSGEINMKDIKQFPHKNKNIRIDKVCGFDFIVHEDLSLKNEISYKLQEIIFGDTIKSINSEDFNDIKYKFIENNNLSLKFIKKEFKNCLPTFETNWNDWNNPNTLKLLLFNGIGQCYVEQIIKPNTTDPTNSKYKVDLSNWEKYDVREDYENYGGICYFDSNLNFIGYVYKSKFITLNDVDFNHVNLIFRSTLITSITLKEHLITTHWIASNGILISSLKFLSHTHILRRFLRSFTFGTASINHASTLALAPFEGIAGRTFGFTSTSWNLMISDQLATIQYESIEDKFVHSNLSEEFKSIMPYYQDGIELWKINKEYVSNFINIYYPDDGYVYYDYELREYWKNLQKYFTTSSYSIGKLNKINLINHLTYSIFMVTAGHSFYGSVCEYLLTPDALMPKILKNTNDIYVSKADTQTYIQALCIISMTSTPMPKLINDWEYLFDNTTVKKNKTKYNMMLLNMKTWQTNLINLSDKIDKLNKIRPIIFNAFNPETLDCSVSV